MSDPYDEGRFIVSPASYLAFVKDLEEDFTDEDRRRVRRWLDNLPETPDDDVELTHPRIRRRLT